VPGTTVPRATFDAMRYARTPRGAVVALDMMAAAGLTTVPLMRDSVGRKQTWTGIQRARDAVRWRTTSAARRRRAGCG
jgi:hypothetical protein